MRDRVSEGLSYAWQQISGAFSTVSSWITNGLNYLWSRVSSAFSSVSSWITDGLSWLASRINGLLSAAQAVITAGLGWVLDKLREGLGGLWTAISTTLSNVGNAVWNAMGSLWDSLTGLAGDLLGKLEAGLLAAFQALLGWFTDQFKSIAGTLAGGLQALMDALGAVLKPIVIGFMDTIKQAFSAGSPDKEIHKAVGDMVTATQNRVVEELKKSYQSPFDAGATILTASTISGLVLAAQIGVHAAASAAGISIMGTRIDFTDVVESAITTMGLRRIVSDSFALPIEIGLLLPLRYSYNQLFAPYVPQPQDLTRLTTTRILGASEYSENMRLQGYSEGWSDKMLQAAWRVPAYQLMQEMVWRGEITAETMQGALRVTGTREDFVAGYTALLDQLPSYADTIRIFVREGYLPEYQAEIPAGMLDAFKLIGYSEKTAKELWGAHWVLPSTGQVFEMLHRDVISLDVMKTYLKTADILGSWRDRLISISWDLPGRIDARWMAAWGLITPGDYGDLLVKRGLDPAWRDRVAEATVKQQMSAEINKIRDNSKSDYGKGYVTEAQLAADLKELGYNPERVAFHVADAKADRERAHKDGLLKLYGDAYQNDLLDDAAFQRYAQEIIVDADAITLFLQEAYFKKYKNLRAG